MSKHEEILDSLEKRAYGYMPESKDMTGMYAGAEIPADSFLIKMIKADPEALKHYNLAVERVYYKFKNMQKEVASQIPTQMDMAHMFNNPIMSEMGTMQGAEMQNGDMLNQQQGAQGEENLEGQPSDLPEGTMVDAQGNPIPPEDEEALSEEEAMAAEEARGAEEQMPGEEAPPEEGEEFPEEEEEEDTYPFGQRNKKKKKKSVKSKEKKKPKEELDSDGNEAAPAQTPMNEEAPASKTAKPSLVSLLRRDLLERD